MRLLEDFFEESYTAHVSVIIPMYLDMCNQVSVYTDTTLQ